jgi:site-specific recombinase XerD
MTLLAPTLQAFFTTRLSSQFGASPHTTGAYRDAWRILLRFVADATGVAPQDLDLSALTADLVGDFLTHLETSRGNSITTRNARLAAIHSFFAYAAYQHPEHAATINQVMAIPSKRHHRTDITYLTPPEVTALLRAPDHHTQAGRRDQALLQLAVTTGLRVSELTALRPDDLHLGIAAHVACRGKGRKDRVTPLDTQTVTVLHEFTASLPRSTQILFPTRTGTRMSRDAVAARLAHHVLVATATCPTLATKKITPHVLRHTAAMRLLAAGIDSAVIALWLGHESIETTQIYLHADMRMKQAALDKTTPTGVDPGRYTPTDDTLLAFLQGI